MPIEAAASPATPAAGAPATETAPVITVPVAPPPPPNPASKANVAPKVEPKVEPVKPAPKEAHEDFLTSEFPPDDPLWKGGHKGLPTFKEILEVTSEPGRQFLANVRADYSTKTAELARAREAMRTELAAERATLAAERARYAQLATPEFMAHLESLRTAAKDADPFTAEGQAKLAEAKAVELYERMISPIQEQIREEAQRSHYRAYISANPDFEQPEVRKGVMKILQAKPHLGLEEAHDLWRGSRAREEATRLRNKQNETDAERAKTLRMTGAGGLANTETEAIPVFKNATEALRYHQARGMK